MPRLWTGSMESHRQQVREAVLEGVSHLLATSGLPSVTMTEIARRAGVGRATLYKYFPDLQAVLLAWHDHLLDQHIAELRSCLETGGDGWDRLELVLLRHAEVIRGRHGADVAAIHLLVQEAVPAAEGRARPTLESFLASVIDDAAREGFVSPGLPSSVLASYCVGALGAASAVNTDDELRRLVELTLDGLARE